MRNGTWGTSTALPAVLVTPLVPVAGVAEPEAVPLPAVTPGTTVVAGAVPEDVVTPVLPVPVPVVAGAVLGIVVLGVVAVSVGVPTPLTTYHPATAAPSASTPSRIFISRES